MARPLRIEFPGAVYHVTARGNRREPIFTDDEDRAALLRILGSGLQRYDAQVLAFCLMGNHYHLVLRTQRANLSQLMRHVNGVYTQAVNRRHAKLGHVFQGRFKAILVDRDAYLMQVCRYVDLNPVRAQLVNDAVDWPWSSCRMHLGIEARPAWLDSRVLLAQLLGRDISATADEQAARQTYAQWLRAGRDTPLWPLALRQQIYLGDADFVERMQAWAASAPGAAQQDDGQEQATSQPAGISAAAGTVPRAQTRPPQTLQQWLEASPSRAQGLRNAHVEGGHSLTAMARELGLSVSWVSRLVSSAAAQARNKT
jgi:REP element-mobilizing transposase RayT